MGGREAGRQAGGEEGRQGGRKAGRQGKTGRQGGRKWRGSETRDGNLVNMRLEGCKTLDEREAKP